MLLHHAHFLRRAGGSRALSGIPARERVERALGVFGRLRCQGAGRKLPLPDAPAAGAKLGRGRRTDAGGLVRTRCFTRNVSPARRRFHSRGLPLPGQPGLRNRRGGCGREPAMTRSRSPGAAPELHLGSGVPVVAVRHAHRYVPVPGIFRAVGLRLARRAWRHLPRVPSDGVAGSAAAARLGNAVLPDLVVLTTRRGHPERCGGRARRRRRARRGRVAVPGRDRTRGGEPRQSTNDRRLRGPSLLKG